MLMILFECELFYIYLWYSLVWADINCQFYGFKDTIKTLESLNISNNETANTDLFCTMWQFC